MKSFKYLSADFRVLLLETGDAQMREAQKSAAKPGRPTSEQPGCLNGVSFKSRRSRKPGTRRLTATVRAFPGTVTVRAFPGTATVAKGAGGRGGAPEKLGTDPLFPCSVSGRPGADGERGEEGAAVAQERPGVRALPEEGLASGLPVRRTPLQREVPEADPAGVSRPRWAKVKALHYLRENQALI